VRVVGRHAGALGRSGSITMTDGDEFGAVLFLDHDQCCICSLADFLIYVRDRNFVHPVEEARSPRSPTPHAPFPYPRCACSFTVGTKTSLGPKCDLAET
jgi:hypothetical protein